MRQGVVDHQPNNKQPETATILSVPPNKWLYPLTNVIRFYCKVCFKFYNVTIVLFVNLPNYFGNCENTGKIEFIFKFNTIINLIETSLISYLPLAIFLCSFSLNRIFLKPKYIQLEYLNMNEFILKYFTKLFTSLTINLGKLNNYQIVLSILELHDSLFYV